MVTPLPLNNCSKEQERLAARKRNTMTVRPAGWCSACRRLQRGWQGRMACRAALQPSRGGELRLLRGFRLLLLVWNPAFHINLKLEIQGGHRARNGLLGQDSGWESCSFAASIFSTSQEAALNALTTAHSLFGTSVSVSIAQLIVSGGLPAEAGGGVSWHRDNTLLRYACAIILQPADWAGKELCAGPGGFSIRCVQPASCCNCALAAADVEVTCKPTFGTLLLQQ